MTPKTDLPRSYAIAIKNQYLGHLETMVSCIEVGSLAAAAEEQIRASEILRILHMLGETDIVKKLNTMDQSLGHIYHCTKNKNERNKKYQAKLKLFRGPLGKETI